jgi:hypothetical protein
VISRIVTSATVGQAIAGEDALDGADGGKGSDAFFVEEVLDGFGSAGDTAVVKTEPFHNNDLFDLVAGAGA